MLMFTRKYLLNNTTKQPNEHEDIDIRCQPACFSLCLHNKLINVVDKGRQKGLECVSSH